MSTPRRPTAERQQQIAEAALRIITGKGVHRLTTQELAREVGISDGSLFRHFKDKAEIIRAAIGFLERTLFEGFPPQADDPLERLRLFFVHRLELVQRLPQVFLAAVTDRLEEAAGDDAGAVRSIIERSQAFIRKCLLEAEAQGLLRPGLSVDALTLVVMGTLQAVAFGSRRQPKKSHLKPEVAWQTIEIMIRKSPR